MRRPPRRPTVLLTYPGLRLGNYLYFMLYADRAQRAGRNVRVLDSGLGGEWVDLFPDLGPLLLPIERLGRWARRENIPPLFLQEFGVDFTVADLERFVRLRLLSSAEFRSARAHEGVGEPTSVTVNIRRGDYYSEPQHRRVYGFDVAAYVDRALADVLEGSEITTVFVVSDDPGWAAEALAPLTQGRPVVALSTGDARSDFINLTASRRLVVTNSAFSYWGAYIAQVRFGDDHGGVWAPGFGKRDVRSGIPWQHAPTWSVIGSPRDWQEVA